MRALGRRKSRTSGARPRGSPQVLNKVRLFWLGDGDSVLTVLPPNLHITAYRAAPFFVACPFSRVSPARASMRVRLKGRALSLCAPICAVSGALHGVCFPRGCPKGLSGALVSADLSVSGPSMRSFWKPLPWGAFRRSERGAPWGCFGSARNKGCSGASCSAN